MVVDEVEKPGVVEVADATVEGTYREADLPSASDLIVTLSDDTTAIPVTPSPARWPRASGPKEKR